MLSEIVYTYLASMVPMESIFIYTETFIYHSFKMYLEKMLVTLQNVLIQIYFLRSNLFLRQLKSAMLSVHINNLASVRRSGVPI